MARDARTTNGPPDAEDLEALERGLEDGGVDRPTRRRLLEGAALGVAAAGALGLPSGAAADGRGNRRAESLRQIADVLATSEGFGVTFLSEAVRRAPGTPSAQFVDVLKAANTAEFDHIRALRRIGGRRLVDRYWIPEAAFGAGGAGLFASIEAVEVVEISAYLLGVTRFARARQGGSSRLLAEAMGTEAEHRVLARFAQNALGAPRGVPNDKSFETFLFATTGDHVRALEALGIGFGRQGATPGAFYEYPGNPVRNGTGLPTSNRRPD